MNDRGTKTIPGAFAARVAAQGGDIALHRGAGGEQLRGSDYAERACRLAAGLQALGVRPGGRVALMLRNRPEFHVADMAVLLAGATPVSIYNSSPAERIAYVVNHAEASVAIVEDDFAERIASATSAMPTLRAIVTVGDGAAPGHASLRDLAEAAPVDLDAAAAAAAPGDLATIIYTSGTTGDPKGVMLTHANVMFAVDTYSRVLGRSLRGLRQVSFLPTAHIAERMATHYFHVCEGSVVTTCEDLAALVPTMVAVQPEWFFSAPRLWEKLQGAIEAMAAREPRAGRFAEARRLGWDVFVARRDTGHLPAGLADEWAAVRREAVAPLLSEVGLGEVIIALTGAAPTPRHTAEFFLSCGVPLSEVWGMSETTGLGTWSPHRIVPGTVGRPVPGVEIRLEPAGENHGEGAGEVIIRGPCVFAGYLKDPSRTAEVLDADGWLRTGDIGRFDAEGNLAIVDRIKDIIVPSSGHNVSPVQLEALLVECPLISQACVVGDGRPHAAALVVLEPEAATRPDVRAEIAAFVDDVNTRVAPAERIVAFEILTDEWPADSDLLTPTLKLKRRAIHHRYADVIERLYASDHDTQEVRHGHR